MEDGQPEKKMYVKWVNTLWKDMKRTGKQTEQIP